MFALFAFSQRILVGCLLLLMAQSVMAWNGCPRVADIQRTSGEYSWYSLVPGWTGAFIYPMQGKGSSTHVTQFIETRWIQLNNLDDSAGYFECDYQGNYDSEVIRFMQAGTMALPKPTHMHWSCQLNPHFPGAQCVCSAGPELCMLEERNGSVPEPIVVNPGVGGLPPVGVDVYRDK